MGTICTKTENQQNSLKIKIDNDNTNNIQKDILKNYKDINKDKQQYIKSIQPKQKKTFNKSLPFKTKEEQLIYNYHNKYPGYQIDYFTQNEKYIVLRDLNKNTKRQQQIKLIRTIKCKEDKILGTGSFGTVTRGFDLNNRLSMAIKRIYLGPEREIETNKKELIKEVDFLKDLQHPNIVKYYGYEIDKDYLKIYLEYIDMGSISSMLKKHGSFPEEIVINYTKQILDGLKYLHSKGVIHRDIKGANILVTNDGQIKLSDFGSARKLQQSLVQTVKGTTSWMAPEVMKDMLIYGVQVVLYMKCQQVDHHLKVIIQQFKKLDISLKVINFKEENFKIKKNISKLAQDFILSCMRKSPYDRKNVIKLQQHPFLIKKQDEFEKDLFNGKRELKFTNESLNHQFKNNKKQNQDHSTAIYSIQNSRSQIKSKNSSMYDQKIREIYQKLNKTKKKKRKIDQQKQSNKKSKLFKINFDESF